MADPKGKPPLPLQADRAFFVVSNLGILVAEQPPTELYVDGSIINGQFVPDGPILGEGTIGQAEGKPGWVELADQSFHSAMTARPPFAPYIEGVLSDSGGFVPSSRQVNF